MHLPVVQATPDVQVFPHDPQLLSSLCSSVALMHTPLHSE
jgi:hypothetical protein